MASSFASIAPPPSATTPRVEGRYVGRFAPSPTGELHLGSLVTAVGSYLEAQRQGGDWLIRIEDLDQPRRVAGADEAIKRSLEAHGLYWTGPIVYQSDRLPAYEAALTELEARDWIYGCGCSRQEIRRAGRIGIYGVIYPGTCRNGVADGRTIRALRVRAPDWPITLYDPVQGWLTQRLAREVGDFVVRRADGLFAYQLAVVVDDAWQGVTEVVRGADLFASTPRQVFLHQLLGFAVPAYRHLPVVLDAQGRKLSKQTQARPVDPRHPAPSLVTALRFLGQSPPSDLGRSDRETVWQWARAHWDPGAIPRCGGQAPASRAAYAPDPLAEVRGLEAEPISPPGGVSSHR